MDKTMTLKALKLAQSALGSSGVEKLEVLFKIREVVISDDSIAGTDQRNTHPAFRAILESLSEVKEPDLFNDLPANEAGDYSSVLNASNLVGIVASLARLLEELKAKQVKDSEILNNSDVKCIISQCRNLAGV